MKQVQPAMLSISNVTESGLVYSPDEVRALHGAIAARGLKLHLDGARFPNAVASLGCSPAEITWRAGVDVLCFGGSKIGGLAAEAIIFFDPADAKDVQYRFKRSGHVTSKMRFVAAQFEALLTDGHWLELARYANGLAADLARAAASIPGCRLAWECQANEVFLIADAARADRWRAAGLRAHPWSPRALAPGNALVEGEQIIRFVTSFNTSADDVTRVVALMRGV